MKIELWDVEETVGDGTSLQAGHVTWVRESDYAAFQRLTTWTTRRGRTALAALQYVPWLLLRRLPIMRDVPRR
jgi:hypothetical protein